MVVVYIVLLFRMQHIPRINTLTHPDLNRSQPPLFIWVRLSCDWPMFLLFLI
jgi:hypothetical protein